MNTLESSTGEVETGHNILPQSVVSLEQAKLANLALGVGNVVVAGPSLASDILHDCKLLKDVYERRKQQIFRQVSSENQ